MNESADDWQSKFPIHEEVEDCCGVVSRPAMSAALQVPSRCCMTA